MIAKLVGNIAHDIDAAAYLVKQKFPHLTESQIAAHVIANIIITSNISFKDVRIAYADETAAICDREFEKAESQL